MIVQSRLAVLGPRLRSAQLSALPGPERNKAQLGMFVKRTTSEYQRACMLNTILCPVSDPAQLPSSDALAAIRAFAAYSFAQYAVASRFVASGELMALDRRLGVKAYEALCSIMAKVPRGSNTDFGTIALG